MSSILTWLSTLDTKCFHQQHHKCAAVNCFLDVEAEVNKDDDKEEEDEEDDKEEEDEEDGRGMANCSL